MIKKLAYTIIILFISQTFLFAQQLSFADTNMIGKKKNPKVASLLSAAVPGLGQIYNEQYWKVPIIYGGFGTMAYFVKFNDVEYQKWLTAYQYRTDEDSLTIDNYPMASTEQLKKLKDEWRRYRDLNYIGIFVLYFLNVIDASVDAHLFDYDISDDLTLHIEPAYIDPRTLVYSRNISTYPVGLKFTFRF
mgnify:CR=1 FL=1